MVVCRRRELGGVNKCNKRDQSGSVLLQGLSSFRLEVSVQSDQHGTGASFSCEQFWYGKLKQLPLPVSVVVVT